MELARAHVLGRELESELAFEVLLPSRLGGIAEVAVRHLQAPDRQVREPGAYAELADTLLVEHAEAERDLLLARHCLREVHRHLRVVPASDVLLPDELIVHPKLHEVVAGGRPVVVVAVAEAD